MVPASEKICPACKKWTKWTNTPGDKCVHCGFDLLAQQVQEEKVRKEKFYEKPTRIITIKEGTHPILVKICEAINFVYIIFVGIMAAIVWFITTVVA